MVSFPVVDAALSTAVPFGLLDEDILQIARRELVEDRVGVDRIRPSALLAENICQGVSGCPLAGHRRLTAFLGDRLLGWSCGGGRRRTRSGIASEHEGAWAPVRAASKEGTGV